MSGTLNKGSLVKGTGGSGGGGSASFPTIVTDSGSSLPSASGYQEGDTFLNTSDKKIYKTLADTYEWNTDVTHGSVTIDFTTGIVTDLSIGSQLTKNLQRTFNENLWTGNKSYQIKFKINSFPNNYIIGLLCIYYNSSSYSHIDIGIGVDKKIKYVEGYYSTGSNTINKEVSLDTILEINKEYTLIIDKNDSNCNLTLLDNGVEIKRISFEVTSSFSQSLNTVYLGTTFMGSGYGSYRNLETYGEIYLLETSFDFLKASSELSWDNGVAIEDKNEYADKTNGILYLYENSELVKIGGNLTKEVYTISADNTSTLDVSSDFTKVVDVLKNGVELALTDDYTISSGVITFVTALSTTDKITVKGE